MTLFWAPSPPLWHPPVAIVPYYLYAIAGKFSVQVIPGYLNAPPPPMGAGLAKWGRSSREKGISPDHEELNKARSEGQLMSPFSSSGF